MSTDYVQRNPFYVVLPHGVAYPAPNRADSIELSGTRRWENVVLREGWLVADAPVDALRGVTVQTQPGGWRKRTAEEFDLAENAAAAFSWSTLPETLSPAGVEDFEEVYGSPHRFYIREQGPAVETPFAIDVTGMRPLPGELPTPGADWKPDSPAMVGVYGKAVAHLMPGSLGGFRNAVVRRLEQADLPGLSVYNHSGPAVKVYYDVLWDAPVPRKRQPRDGRKRGPFTSGLAHKVHVEHVVPERLSAPNLAQAEQIWDQAVETWASLFIPTEQVQGCSHCSGRGFILPTAVTP